MRKIVSFSDLTKGEIDAILQLAKRYKSGSLSPCLQDKILAVLFFEPSTRTRLSFESAIWRLGGKVIGWSEATNSSVKKGESFYDTIKTVESYADAIVLRHPEAGSAERAARFSSIPVINAGDGANEHPTQTLLDLFTIQETQGRLEGVKLALVGDLKYSRTIHSLVLAAMTYHMPLYCVCPPSLALPEQLVNRVKRNGLPVKFCQNLEEVISEADVIYMTRQQKERTTGSIVEQDWPVLTKAMLKNASTQLRVLHPLPRGKEIDVSVDTTSHAAYFSQVKNGLYVRQAILSFCFYGLYVAEECVV